MPDLDRPDQKVFDSIESGSAKLVHKQLFRIWMVLGKKAFNRIRIRKTGPQVIIPDLDGTEKKDLLSDPDSPNWSISNNSGSGWV
jgi:hypothetical protein